VPIEHIGPGGFGSVERVRDDEGSEYALKTLHLGFDAGVLTAETENLRRVEHENVVGYVDHGIDPEPFLVMQLATGGTLKDYVGAAAQDGEHFPISTVLDWAAQLLRGLSAIHEVLLHRDLKPANVLFHDNLLKIADFGMTRLVEASTRTETLKGGGTPLYMPPEGWAGQTGPTPTPGYDLYSLGVILYELATLQVPFTGGREARGRTGAQCR
jgi:serine/threonine protein kinase